MKRNGQPGFESMDDLDYYYNKTSDGKLINNRLNYVDDLAVAGNPNDDIEDQNPGNYTYDAIGNLTGDVKEEIGVISWNVANKITRISRTLGSKYDNISFRYDGMGNRIMKSSWSNTGLSDTENTWYVCDAQGNVMAVYKWQNNNNPSLNEQYIYGSTRLGYVNRGSWVDNTIPAQEKSYIGLRQYELTNHLGNVLTTVSDRRFAYPRETNPMVGGYTADIKSSQDYYPFGSLMPGRNYSSSSYRFGFNGKEMDNEVSGTGNQYDYGFRIYNPRIGKFLSVDPLAFKFPSMSGYAAFNNNPIYFVDPDGRENIPALLWARSKMSNKGIGNKNYLDYWLGGSEKRWTYKVGQVPDYTVCYESCFMAYMNSGDPILSYLKETGFSNKYNAFKGRSHATGGANWFKAGDGTDRSFVTNIANGELGDMVFMGSDIGMMGHAVLLNELPTMGTIKDANGKSIETMTLNVLSTSSDSDSGNYGERSMQFQKVGNKWLLDGDGYEFKGYGQLNEDFFQKTETKTEGN